MGRPQELQIHVGTEERDAPKRQHFLQLLQNLPGFMDTVKTLVSRDAFRVVMSPENAHLFVQAADGTYKPFLRETGKFVENVDLVKIPKDYARAASDLSMMVNMAMVAAKLEAIEVGLRNIAQVMANTERGRVKGAIDALALARLLSNSSERRQNMLLACQMLTGEIGALVGQLQAHVAAMPRETTGWFDGIFGNGLDDATNAFNQVNDDIAVLIESVAALLRAYDDLNEPATAREALTRILTAIEKANLSDAVRKARLVPVTAGKLVPEAKIRALIESISVMKARLLADGITDNTFISIDIEPKELGL